MGSGMRKILFIILAALSTSCISVSKQPSYSREVAKIERRNEYKMKAKIFVFYAILGVGVITVWNKEN